MRLMSPTDSMFIIPESRDQPMHVGSLQLLRTPDGAEADFLQKIYRELLAVPLSEIAPDFRKRAHRSFGTLGQWTWIEEDDVDLEHHIRHSALPRPGRIRELLALVSRLHSTLLDRQRPLWEMHVIEGLSDGRIAIYTKMHHAMMDGVSGLRLLQQSMSEDPDELSPLAWFGTEVYNRRPPRPAKESGGLLALPGVLMHGVGDVIGLAPGLIRTAERTMRDSRAAKPFQAPRSVFNVGITGARRFAAQSWPMERFATVRKATGASFNDVVMTVCAGALRAYLLELGELPDASLIAMAPVSLRRDASSGGNAVGSIMCNLGTDVEDPVERLGIVRDSMLHGKQSLEGLSTLQASALAALTMASSVPPMMSPSAGSLLPPTYNLVISNVPGPRVPLYWRGAKVDGIYPLSIPNHGQALNITLTTYAGSVEFGLTGCRRQVPHLQRLLTHIEDSLAALEKLAA